MHHPFRILSLMAVALLTLTPPSFAVGAAELLVDISTTSASGGSTTYGVSSLLIPLGNRVLFFGYEPSSGDELWASDGTSRGTALLRDMEPGPESSSVQWLGNIRQTAIFLRELKYQELEVWASDGTVEGTFPISNLSEEPVTLCSGGSRPAVAGTRLFFLASRTGGACGLWKSDGTKAGTVLVEDAFEIGGIQDLVAAGDRVFFSAPGSLWTSDGTAAGTVLLRRFEVLHPEGPRELQAAGSRAVFIAQAVEGGGEELWISNGTAAGTRALTRFVEPLPFGYGWPVVKEIGGTLYFAATDGTGFDLWQSDGSGAAPRRVTDFAASAPFGDGLDFHQLVKLGDRLIFSARDEGDQTAVFWVSGGSPESTTRLDGCPGGCPQMSGPAFVQIGQRALFLGFDFVEGSELWSTDGTGPGTRRLTDFLCRGFCSSFDLPRLTPLLGRVFFVAAAADGRSYLWKSDGTVQGTLRVADLGPLGGVNENEFAPVVAGGKIFFSADPGRRGSQLWVSNGSTETGLVSIIRGAAPGSSPFGMTPFGGGVLFGAFQERNPILWQSDGTATAPLAAGLLSYQTFAVVGGLAYFLKADAASQRILWRTDGTDAGTFRLTPDGIGGIGEGTVVGNRLLFVVHDPEDPSQTRFWESDGTVAGTRQLSDLPADAHFVSFLRGFGPRLYFIANKGDGTGREQLWVSDGTTTFSLTNFSGYAFDNRNPPAMAQAGGTLYFAAHRRLWKTDGTVAGTAAVPLPPASGGDDPTDFVPFRNALYFMAGTGEETAERGLWRSDGTEAGTYLVKPAGNRVDGRPGRAWMTVVGDRLFFVADDGEHGAELWASDGTAGGTALVRDISPGEASSSPTWLAAAGGRIYFSASDGESGFELWESDGTAHGTHRTHDIAPGAFSSNPRELAVAGGRLYFTADDGIYGEEPWVLLLDGAGCVPSAEALCLGGRFRVEAHWRDPQGHEGAGRAVALTADTGTFWFFDATNVEIILKVLDGQAVNGHRWVFYGALSNVEYTLTVTDTRTGAVRRYVNPPGRLGSVADTEAFGPRGASLAGVVTEGPAPEVGEAPLVAVRSLRATGSCTPGAERLCLNGGRFAVEARWKDFEGHTGTGKAVPLAGGDTGYFWFFDAGNVEVVLKVLDGRPLNGKFWVFYGALSNVEYTLTVTDTETGKVRTYTNPSGRLASVADTGAF